VILVDSSVWIDYFRGTETPQVEVLDGLLGRTRLAIGDLIVVEVLQGVRDQKEFDLVRKTLDAFTQVELVGYDIAVKAARNYRTLRGMGITVRKTIDSIIATRCIESGLTLLHSDRDFLPFVEHLGLKVAYSETY
jgi:predicted nucleic acid-binding protein